MAIKWGAWEYSGGNGMRVGIDVSWEAISHGEAAATATVKYYTENQYSYGDSQSLNLSGAIDGSIGYTNSQGGAATLRGTRTYTYNYGACEYGSSPGSRTFKATVSGAFNGVTPTASVTSSIPARPIAAPAAPTNVSVSRISDTSTKVTWTNKDTCGEPWARVEVQRIRYPEADYALMTNADGSATSYTNGTASNNRYRYRVRSENSAGVSAWVYTDYIWTTPAAPTNAARTGASGANQTITWTNQAGYPEYETQIVYYKDGGSEAGAGIAAAGATSFVHTLPSAEPNSKFKYQVRHRPTSGPGYWSPFSNMTTETSGLLSPPNAPALVSPKGSTLVPSGAITATWTHKPTDGSAQTKYEVRWRYSGDLSWTSTGAVASGSSTHAFAANTFETDSTVEWQARTWGSHADPGPWSTSALFYTAADPLAARTNLRTLVLDLDTGEVQTSQPVLADTGWVRFYDYGHATRGGWYRVKDNMVHIKLFMTPQGGQTWPANTYIAITGPTVPESIRPAKTVQGTCYMERSTSPYVLGPGTMQISDTAGTFMLTHVAPAAAIYVDADFLYHLGA